TLLDTLAKADIGSMCYYPVPMHMQKPFAGDYKYGDFPESEKAAAEVLSLPMYPELTDEQVVAVAEAVNKAMAEASAGVTISTPVSTPFPAV
ncbi:MAG: DegT/DnrJ/EryC1/StrS family aminotransferase, partial [Cyanobacteriota/Melainabacteria group bacterium]